MVGMGKTEMNLSIAAALFKEVDIVGIFRYKNTLVKKFLTSFFINIEDTLIYAGGQQQSKWWQAAKQI